MKGEREGALVTGGLGLRLWGDREDGLWRVDLKLTRLLRGGTGLHDGGPQGVENGQLRADARHVGECTTGIPNRGETGLLLEA